MFFEISGAFYTIISLYLSFHQGARSFGLPRITTLPPERFPSPLPNLPLLISNLIYQRADLLNLNPDVTTILKNHTWLAEEANPGGCARQEDGASLQRSTLTEVADLLRDGEDHVPESIPRQ